MENILSLPVQHVRDSLTIEEQAQQFVGMHTFGDTLDRLLLGHQQLIAANEDLKSMMCRILDRLDRPPDVSATLCSLCSARGGSGGPEPSDSAVVSATLPLRPAPIGQGWPKSLATLKGKHLSDFLVQFFMEGLGSLPKTPGNRSQKDCLRAVEIVGYVADLASIPTLPPSSRELERMLWILKMQNMASQCEAVLVNGFTKATTGAQRKCRRSGKLTGVVKAWSELTEQQRAAFRLLPRIRYSATRTAQS
ncbi:hypothetical protein PHYPSEUDO_013333 [Phytophthora pseudosyringae]|uniref:Uncharacterized protein n=1 Tax=Phytophthora pseudosyringae TaxID=221518 RepID=A0A8T1W3G3_9STRA|nr:hypothetical protein PHYPSEUDO_013333 [Phytophthora pseudosyringae]